MNEKVCRRCGDKMREIVFSKPIWRDDVFIDVVYNLKKYRCENCSAEVETSAQIDHNYMTIANEMGKSRD
jgi:DNA-directed RNA polymerase subunit RPC12/RpoP